MLRHHHPDLTHTAREPRVLCPECGASPDLDESGRPYTCYFCCDMGEVPESWADGAHAAEGWYAYLQAEKRIAAGTYGRFRCVFCDPESYGDCDACGNTGWLDVLPVREAAVAMDLEDIPF